MFKYSAIVDMLFWIGIILFLIGFLSPWGSADQANSTAMWFMAGGVCLLIAIIPWDQFKK